MSNLSSTWFQYIKKIKTDNDFIAVKADLDALLKEGLTVDVTDAKGRDALQQLFAKPSPSALATQWLLAKGAAPDSVDDVRLHIGELYPEVGDSTQQLQDKQYRAAPYLAVMAAQENRDGTEEGIADSAYYQQVFNRALASRQKLENLKTCYDDLPLGYQFRATAIQHPWQSHWGGQPYLPSLTEVPSQIGEQKLLCQLYFGALQGPHPLPVSGLLQVFVDADALDEAEANAWGENYVQRVTTLYWQVLPTNPQGWQPMPQWQLQSEMCKISALDSHLSPVAIDWQPRRQLPKQQLSSPQSSPYEAIDTVIAKLPADLRPDAKALEDEYHSYDCGLLPQLGSLSQEVLPAGHKPFLHLLHQSYGGLLLSLPEQALSGYNTDWQDLTLTRYYH